MLASCVGGLRDIAYDNLNLDSHLNLHLLLRHQVHLLLQWRVIHLHHHQQSIDIDYLMGLMHPHQ